MNIKFKKPTTNFKILDEDQNHGQLIYGPLERGFANTLGNSLRRVMLSSLTGASVYAIKVENVVHEFSSISGVLEKLTDIIINLKKLIFKVDLNLFPENNTTTLVLKVTKAKKITAKSIKCPPEIEVVNKNLYLLTATKDISLTINLFVKVGRGYVSFLDNQKEIKESRVIAIDSLFSPIETVTFHSEEIKSALSKPYENLILDVKTNGAIKVDTAIFQSIEILRNHLDNLKEKLTSSVQVLEDENIFEIDVTDEETDTSILVEDLDFTYKTYNTLKKNGIIYLSEILALTEAELLKLPSFGEVCLNEVKAVLEKRNLSLKI
ncbi:DNA-directed RNA polymerase subunit alpha [Mycoplasma sp. SG1]|uniref:DNA-directed RNA polymerase subunit alpha n=1 Tax=Mycoplasma sp. SG1 TaxID=2810348 RepID=UPI002025290A|nr:DNA-directed RNA polymerase subunit alpha [Mycoplasma sp. SG1]URM52916.1 DNA-directed RNA polymerase subunit alpha [Mycoplasma sp. SG1]